eukprot:3345002-Heterocapsa_arctica.AAC.1
MHPRARPTGLHYRIDSEPGAFGEKLDNVGMVGVHHNLASSILEQVDDCSELRPGHCLLFPRNSSQSGPAPITRNNLVKLHPGPTAPTKHRVAGGLSPTPICSIRPSL